MSAVPPAEARVSGGWKRYLKSRRPLSGGMLFVITVGYTALMWVIIAITHTRPRPHLRTLLGPGPHLVSVSNRVVITSQIRPDDILRLQQKGYRLLVDVRPDGEEPNQPTSAELREAADGQRMDFIYIPVPHDTIPEEAVHKLQVALSSYKSAVLYCRTGRRAARLFALEEASRPGGPDPSAILQMVSQAGFTADDLAADIARRVAQRRDNSSGH
jgi:uncharacterized protein (TIGR01244 family)